jgi:uncharacterized protein YggE
MIRRTCVAAAALGFAISCGIASGQIGGQGVVSGTGTMELARPPELMRMRIVVTTKGSNVTEALAALKDRVTAAKAQLGKLGAEMGSVTTDEPQIAAENSDRRRQMEMLMAQRMRGGARRPAAKKEETKPPVTVQTTLSAHWKLTAGEGDQLLVAVSTLQDKIKAADLAGTKEQSKLSPEEQELSEELGAEQMAMYSGEEGPKPGEPMFVFVAPISAADREKLLAEGYQKAKERAMRLAKAAGAELGALRLLNENEVDASDEALAGNPYNYNAAMYRMAQMMRGGKAEQGEVSEAVGAQPTKVVYRLLVTASFDLQAK